MVACSHHVIKNHGEFIKRSQEQDGSVIDQWKVPLFPTVTGGGTSRTVVLAGWRELASGHEVGGHTPRKMGAERMAKEGWPIRAIQQLGRGASPTALAYVGEAYAEKLCGKAIVVDDGETPLPSLEDRVTKLEGLRVGQTTGAATTAVPVEDAKLQEDDARDSAKPELVFVRSGNDGHGRVRVAGGRLHVKASTSPCTPSFAWTTVCGWEFAQGGDFTLLRPQDVLESRGMTACNKCRKVEPAAWPDWAD